MSINPTPNRNPWDLQNKSPLYSSVAGIVRSGFVLSITQPIDVLKIRKQCSTDDTSTVGIARKILEADGLRGFYRGFTPQLTRNSLRQAWNWPIITHLPPFFEKQGMSTMQAQVGAGLVISIADILFTNPLDWMRIQSVVQRKTPTLQKTYQTGWRGAGINWCRVSVSWITFLSAQKYLREYYRSSDGSLSAKNTCKTAFLVAGLVSAVSAPFDFANTLKQGKNASIRSILRQRNILGFWKGAHLRFPVLVIQNIASTILLECFGQ